MTAPKCPTCSRPVPPSPLDGEERDGARELARWRPFCSERCKLVDLQKWLSGVFAIPGKPVLPSDHGER